MGTAAVRLKMKQLCTILRDANVGTRNVRGNANKPDWQPRATNVPCMSWTGSGNERVADDATVYVAERLRMIVPLGTDVTEADRIGAITDRGAAVIVTPLSIRAVLRHLDHLELVLVEIS